MLAALPPRTGFEHRVHPPGFPGGLDQPGSTKEAGPARCFPSTSATRTAREHNLRLARSPTGLSTRRLQLALGWDWIPAGWGPVRLVDCPGMRRSPLARIRLIACRDGLGSRSTCPPRADAGACARTWRRRIGFALPSVSRVLSPQGMAAFAAIASHTEPSASAGRWVRAPCWPTPAVRALPRDDPPGHLLSRNRRSFGSEHPRRVRQLGRSLAIR